MGVIGSWSFLVAYLGIAVGITGIFQVLSPDQQQKCRPWFMGSMVAIGLATLMAIISRL